MRVGTRKAFIQDIYREVEAGRMAPARTDAPYGWSQAEVERFWDALVKGEPVGSFVTFDVFGRPDTAFNRRVGPAFAVAQPGRLETLVLDGHNRLSTLAWGLSNPASRFPELESLDPAEAEVWASGSDLMLDLEERSVRFVKQEDAVEGRHVSTHALSGSRIFMAVTRQLMAKGVGADAMKWLQSCFANVRSAPVVVNKLLDMTPDQERQVLARVQRGRTPAPAHPVEQEPPPRTVAMR